MKQFSDENPGIEIFGDSSVSDKDKAAQYKILMGDTKPKNYTEAQGKMMYHRINFIDKM